MEKISNILEGVLKQIQKKHRLNASSFEPSWIKVVGKKTALHTQIRSFKKNKLYVSVENSGWLYDLNIRKEAIQEKMQEVSKGKIKEVFFRIGDVGKRVANNK